MKRNVPLISALPSLGLALLCLLAPTVAHAVGGSGPFFDSGVVVGTVGSNSLPEISGVAVSTQNSDVLWVHNDKGNPAEVYALSTDGTLLRTYSLQGVSNSDAVDWEDIAIRTDPVSGVHYLYIADTGDNDQDRPFVTIYRFPEPDVNVIPNGTLTGVEALHVKYPSTKYDCETLLVDLNGDIVMVTRDRANSGSNPAVSHVFSYPVALQVPQAVGATPDPRTLIENESSMLNTPWDIKGGDVSRDGNWVILRQSEGGVAVDGMLWIRSQGTSLSEVFADPFCLVPLAGEPQGEAVSFNADGSGYYTISEGNNQPVYFYAENNNTPPVADSQSPFISEDTDLIITLSASDAELDSLTYAIVSAPADGNLSVISGDQVTYSPDLNFNGTDSFTFVANDGTANSAVATVTITVNPVDDAPVALAGSNQSVFENVVVVLDGSGSFDPDGALTSYAWSQDSGSPVVLSDSGAAQPSFVAPAVSQDTTLVFSLVVSDDTLISAADTVSVTVSPLSYDAFAFQEPTANYGVVTGTVNATSSADGQVQTVTEVKSANKGRKRLEVEYVLQTIAPPESIVSLELNLVHAWTDLDSPGESLEAFVWNGNINVLDWEDISGTLLDTGVFVPSGSPADYVDGNQSIRIQFRDSAEIQREKADTLSIDSLWADIEVGTPDTEPPTAPTGLVLSAGEFEVNLEWDDNPETESDLLGYFVYRRSDTEFGEYTALNIDPVSESAFQDATVNPATTYYYVVTATDISGNESGDSTIVTATTTDLPPSAPANLTATAGDEQVTVDWDDNTETDLAGYNVYRSDVTGPLNGATPIVGNGVVDTGLSNGTSYSYFVTAVDIMGNESGFSAAVSATPTATAEQFLHVKSIDMAVTRKGKNWKAEASVLVTDQSGNPLAGATVTGDWLYNDLPNSSGTVAVTDASGIAVLTSSPEKAKSLDEFRFTVTGVALTGFTYDNGGTTESSVFVP